MPEKRKKPTYIGREELAEIQEQEKRELEAGFIDGKIADLIPERAKCLKEGDVEGAKRFSEKIKLLRQEQKNILGF